MANEPTLPQDALGYHPIQALGIGTATELTITDASQQSAAISSTLVLVSPAETIRVATGTSPSVTKTTGTRVPANTMLWLKINSGDKVAIIAEGTAAAGKCTFTQGV
jgi:hypothetical protein